MRVVKRLIIALMALTVGGLAVAVQPSEAAVRIRFTPAGDLIVLGHNDDETLTIRGTTGDTFEVTIQTFTSVTYEQFTGPIRNVTVNTRGGGDIIKIEDLGQPIRNLTLRLGSGFDQVELRKLDVQGQLRFTQTGPNGSETYLDRLRVDGRTTISLGGGHSFFNSDDNVFADNYRLFTAANARLDFGAELDTYRGTVDVRSGNNRDLIFFSTQTAFEGRSVRINARGGRDDVVLRSDTSVFGSLSVRLGPGDDKARFSEYHSFGPVGVFGDAGDDLVETTFSDFRDRTTFNGGAGDDTYTQVNSTFVIGPDLIGFETVN